MSFNHSGLSSEVTEGPIDTKRNQIQNRSVNYVSSILSTYLCVLHACIYLCMYAALQLAMWYIHIQNVLFMSRVQDSLVYTA